MIRKINFILLLSFILLLNFFVNVSANPGSHTEIIMDIEVSPNGWGMPSAPNKCCGYLAEQLPGFPQVEIRCTESHYSQWILGPGGNRPSGGAWRMPTTTIKHCYFFDYLELKVHFNNNRVGRMESEWTKAINFHYGASKITIDVVPKKVKKNMPLLVKLLDLNFN